MWSAGQKRTSNQDSDSCELNSTDHIIFRLIFSVYTAPLLRQQRVSGRERAGEQGAHTRHVPQAVERERKEGAIPLLPPCLHARSDNPLALTPGDERGAAGQSGSLTSPRSPHSRVSQHAPRNTHHTQLPLELVRCEGHGSLLRAKESQHAPRNTHHTQLPLELVRCEGPDRASHAPVGPLEVVAVRHRRLHRLGRTWSGPCAASIAVPRRRRRRRICALRLRRGPVILRRLLPFTRRLLRHLFGVDCT